MIMTHYSTATKWNVCITLATICVFERAIALFVHAWHQARLQGTFSAEKMQLHIITGRAPHWQRCLAFHLTTSHSKLLSCHHPVWIFPTHDSGMTFCSRSYLDCWQPHQPCRQAFPATSAAVQQVRSCMLPRAPSSASCLLAHRPHAAQHSRKG